MDFWGTELWLDSWHLILVLKLDVVLPCDHVINKQTLMISKHQSIQLLSICDKLLNEPKSTFEPQIWELSLLPMWNCTREL